MSDQGERNQGGGSKGGVAFGAEVGKKMVREIPTEGKVIGRGILRYNMVGVEREKRFS